MPRSALYPRGGMSEKCEGRYRLGIQVDGGERAGENYGPAETVAASPLAPVGGVAAPRCPQNSRRAT